MGRTALYRDRVPYRPARSDVQIDADALLVRMPDGWTRRHSLDGVTASTSDGFVGEKIEVPAPIGRVGRTMVVTQRRFVRMLVLDGERAKEQVVVITPPEEGAVAPNVVSVPEAPATAAIVDDRAWEAVTDWVLGGGRLASLSIADLARLACIATPQFAALIGEVAAQRALEIVWSATGPLRASGDLDSALHPLSDAARTSTRAAEALVAALAHVAGASRRRRRGA